MKTLLKSIVGLCVMAMMCIMGCTKPSIDDNGNNNNNNGNSSGGNSGPDVTVTTYTPSDITTSSAVCGGFVQVVQGLSLTKVGICWSTSPNPTANDSQLSSDAWNEPIVKTISGLSPNTTYHVRAFALRGLEYYYGEDKSFTTLSDGGGGGGGGGTTPTLPSVFTLYVDNVTQTSVLGGGNVTNDGGATVTERGLCWSVSSNPTISDSHLSNGGGTGEFWQSITGLAANTTYHVKAYATNSVGTSYGNEVIFTTISTVSWPDGVLPGVFSVSATKKVHFSQGNLQFIGSAATPYWKFADNQWEFLGDNGQGSTSQNVDRDLFGWGTSGYNHGAVCYQPWATTQDGSCYYAYGSHIYNLYDRTGMADWGYNAICNGGNQERFGWRTLTWQEWYYLTVSRSTESGMHFAKAIVNGIAGVILLPDNWSNFKYILKNCDDIHAAYEANEITASEWTGTIEPLGAVFWPSGGSRSGTSVGLYDNSGQRQPVGHYWTSTQIAGNGINLNNCAVPIYIGNTNMSQNIASAAVRSWARSVRLVKDYQ